MSLRAMKVYIIISLILDIASGLNVIIPGVECPVVSDDGYKEFIGVTSHINRECIVYRPRRTIIASRRLQTLSAIVNKILYKIIILLVLG